MPMLRCGRIAYTNVLPVYAAFDAGAIAYPGSLHDGVPARLNAMLLGGELDMGPLSAFDWANMPATSCSFPGSASVRAPRWFRSCSSRRCRRGAA